MSWQHTLICILSFCTASHSQNYSASRWADSVLATMSLDEKLGQLFVIRSFSTQNEQQIQDVSALIQDYHIGGICFFKGTSGSLYELIQKYQTLSKIPVMVSMDAEWGLGMRITDAFSFPKQMSLGALKENRLIYDLGKEMAIQMKLFGIHMNYAPVLDINNNLNNPVINERSFGSNRQRVLLKSFAFMQGLQDHGVLACVKHFPGHGDTDLDSHKDLPVLNFSTKRLDSLE
ncbi:MAG: glycoside hydrolase family 3 N-terminal domain-containing protein, partial [Saprospiraceae bacterium]